MTDRKKRSTGILHSTDELRQLIIENPELPLIVFAGGEANNSQEYFYYMTCSEVTATKGEFLDCWQGINEERCYTDRQDFKEAVEEWLEYDDDALELSEKEWNALVEKHLKEYEPYWQQCICVYVNN